MNLRFRFEKLTVWQASRLLNRKIYQITRKFPEHEAFGITSQLRRASVSVSTNIAEGSGRNSDKDFAHFLEQAYASLMEVASLLFLAFDEKYIDQSTLDSILDEINQSAGQLVALNRSLKVQTSKTPFARRNSSSALVARPSTLG